MFTEDRYWGELSEVDMTAMLVDIRERGLLAVAESLRRTDPDRFRFFFDHSRADWRFGMTIKPTDWVLDVGCGMGGNTFALCDVVDHVVAFDASWARAKFVQLRATHEQKTNIDIFVGDFMELPLAEGRFDVIIFNGILEWVGQSMKFADPYDVQVWALQKCFRLLRPGGRLYIGIENRWAFTYWTGGEDHIGLPFTSLMPRFLARAYCRVRLGKDYRTYTHGKGGYIRLLQRAGFMDTNVVMPFPGYNDQRLLIPFENTACMSFAIQNLMGALSWKKQLVRVLSRIPGVLWLYRYFFFSYNLYAIKPEHV